MGVPYLLVSLDDRGRKISDLLRGEIEPQSGGPPAGPARPLVVAFLHQPSDDDLSEGVRTLLRGRAAPVHAVEVRLVAELLSPGTLTELPTFLERVSRIVSEVLPGVPAVIETLLVVPHERSAWADGARTFLTNHRSPLLWLVSPFNGRLFTDDELDILCARFLALDVMVGFPARLWDGDRPREGIASFGMSGLVVPAREIRTRTAFRLAADVLTHLASPGGAGAEVPSGDQWLIARRLTFAELNAAVRAGADIPLSERERKVALKRGDEPAWSDRLWSVFYFFGFEGLARQDQRIAANKSAVLDAALGGLRETVDSIIARLVRPAGGLAFLEGLAQAAARERGERIEIGGARAHLHGAIEGLKEAYKRLPASYWGLLARVLPAAFGAAYLLHLVWPALLPSIRGHTLTSFWILLLILGGMGILITALFYMDRHNEFGKARLAAESVLWRGIEYIVTARAHNGALDVLNTLVCAAASPAQREEFRVACEAIESTHAAVSRYVGRLREAADIARHRSEEPIVTAPFLTFPVRPLATAPELAADRLAARLVGEGFHRGWRDIEPEQLSEKAAGLLDQVVGPSSVQSLTEVFPPPSDPEAPRLMRSLTEGARPLLVLGSGAPPPRRLVLAQDGSGSAMAKTWQQTGVPAMWLPLDDPYSMIVLSVVHGLTADDLIAVVPKQAAGHD